MHHDRMPENPPGILGMAQDGQDSPVVVGGTHQVEHRSTSTGGMNLGRHPL
jgi:hypothetical protein